MPQPSLVQPSLLFYKSEEHMITGQSLSPRRFACPRLGGCLQGFCSPHVLMLTTSGGRSVRPQTRTPAWSQMGPTNKLGPSCQAGTAPSSPMTTLPGFTSSHLEYLLSWKITPGLLQGKAQDPGATPDPSLGLVPAEGAHEGNSGAPSGKPQERQPWPLVRCRSECWGPGPNPRSEAPTCPH